MSCSQYCFLFQHVVHCCGCILFVFVCFCLLLICFAQNRKTATSAAENSDSSPTPSVVLGDAASGESHEEDASEDRQLLSISALTNMRNVSNSSVGSSVGGGGGSRRNTPVRPFDSPVRKQSRASPVVFDAGEHKRCNCKNSKCLKLYCECFAASTFCVNCNCQGCCNNEENVVHRDDAIKATLVRNPRAFQPKIAASSVGAPSPSSSAQFSPGGDGMQVPSSPRSSSSPCPFVWAELACVFANVSFSCSYVTVHILSFCLLLICAVGKIKQPWMPTVCISKVVTVRSRTVSNGTANATRRASYARRTANANTARISKAAISLILEATTLPTNLLPLISPTALRLRNAVKPTE